MKSLVFVISLPRSGSTLLQRLLGSHEDVATLSEISLLLRFLGGPKEVFRYADYCESNLEYAMADIRKVWSGFDQTYFELVSSMMHRIYDNLSNEKEVFIDKTPRYTLIAEEIYKCFPDAKFLVLWRHPLAIAASISKTFSNEKWYLDDFMIDLTRGLDRLNAFDFPERDRVFSLCYEDLVQSPNSLLSEVGEFLGLKNLAEVLKEPLLKTNHGSLGDPTGIRTYKEVSKKSIHKWKEQYENFYRQKWAKNYFSGQRQKWLNERGYYLPYSFESLPIHKNVYCSFKDFFYRRRKNKKRLKAVAKAVKKQALSNALIRIRKT